jgi:hypothetical protein
MMFNGPRGVAYNEAFALKRLPEKTEDLSPIQRALIRDFIVDQEYYEKQRGLVEWGKKKGKSGSAFDAARAYMEIHEKRWKVARISIERWFGGRSVGKIRTAVFDDVAA